MWTYAIKCTGNEKLGAKKEPDPDPAPYLFLTFEMKRYTQHIDAWKYIDFVEMIVLSFGG